MHVSGRTESSRILLSVQYPRCSLGRSTAVRSCGPSVPPTHTRTRDHASTVLGNAHAPPSKRAHQLTTARRVRQQQADGMYAYSYAPSCPGPPQRPGAATTPHSTLYRFTIRRCARSHKTPPIPKLPLTHNQPTAKCIMRTAPVARSWHTPTLQQVCRCTSLSLQIDRYIASQDTAAVPVTYRECCILTRRSWAGRALLRSSKPGS